MKQLRLCLRKFVRGVLVNLSRGKLEWPEKKRTASIVWGAELLLVELFLLYFPLSVSLFTYSLELQGFITVTSFQCPWPSTGRV